MPNFRVSTICIIVAGAFLLPDVSDAKCICTKRINDHCCQTPDNDPSRKDACCHIKGFAVQPPQWQCDKNHNSECVEDVDCRMGGKCHECECHSSPGPEPKPKPKPKPRPTPGPEPTLGPEPKPKPIPKSKSTPGPEPTPGPDPDECPEDSACSPNKPCVEKNGEVCMCAGCICHCSMPMQNGECGDDAVCRTDQDCQNGSKNTTRINAKCVDCTCMSTMRPDCDAEVDDCSKDSDCPVPKEDKDRCKGYCEKSICTCMINC